MILIIIGNGFDLNYGLPTSVDDFIDSIEKYDIQGLYDNYSMYWHEYEDSLSQIDIDIISESFEGPDYTSDRESDRDGGIFKMGEIMDELATIKDNALREMVENANEYNFLHNNTVYKKFKKESIILNFNYTSTVEDLFNQHNIRDILHIHGLLNKGERLIFGYAESNVDVLRQFSQYDIHTGNYLVDHGKELGILQMQEASIEYEGIDYYFHQQYDKVFEFYNSNKKVLEIKKLIDYLIPYKKEISEIVVLGHSLNQNDGPYFEIIEDIINPKNWFVSQYNGHPSIKDILSFTFKDKISFFDSFDFIVSDF